MIQPTTISNQTVEWLVGGFNPFEKNISQIGSCPQVGVKITNIWNHHPDDIFPFIKTEFWVSKTEASLATKPSSRGEVTQNQSWYAKDGKRQSIHFLQKMQSIPKICKKSVNIQLNERTERD